MHFDVLYIFSHLKFFGWLQLFHIQGLLYTQLKRLQNTPALKNHVSEASGNAAIILVKDSRAISSNIY